jgi:predicted acylesterase/phospholipase RssA
MRALAAAVLLFLAAGARPAEAGPTTRPGVVSLTVSGGVSLGAYEAGFLLHALDQLRGDERRELRLLTGASAGSLNGLLAVLGACGDQVGPPARSLFWSTWIPVGFDQLFVPSAAAPLGAFSREWLERGAGRIEEAWGRGLDASCDLVLGVAATRLAPRTLRAAGGHLELPRMEEKFAVRVRGRGPGRPPSVVNYRPADGVRPEPLLVTDAAGEVPFAALRDLLLASMAFPVAFPPVELSTCLAGATAAPGVCLPAEAEAEPYVDGGVFDNGPLRLAVGLARGGLAPAPGGGLRWREAPDARARATPGEVTFAFVDPDATEYPPAPPPAARPGRPSLPRELGEILSSLVETARAKELAVLLEEEPEIADRILLPRRRFPAAGAPLLAFLGFFETEFRSFDFSLGMYDAQRLFDDARAAGAALPAPAAGGPPADGDPALARFACMRAVYDGGPGAAEACQAPELADFRSLLQVSLDQLYQACGRLPPEGAAAWRNPHCQRAARGEPPPRVPALSPVRWPDWHQRPAEPELAYSLRLLGDYGFRFHDLGVPPGRGDLALLRIRAALGGAARALAAAQPWADRPTVAFAAKLAADTVAYSPPDHVLHLTMGPTETELGMSRGFYVSRWWPRGLRLSWAVGLRGLGQVFSSRDTEPFAVVGAGGVELQPPPGSSVLAQLRFGLRAGWLLAADDRWDTGRCKDRGRASVSSCSRPVVQALAGVTALERFRVQLVGEWYPGTATRATQWSLAPGIGLELGF